MDSRPTASGASPVLVSPATGGTAIAFVFAADIKSGFRELLRHEIERRSRRDQLFLLGGVLEIPDDALGVLHHPPAYISLIDRLALLRVFLQVRDAGEAERQFRVVEMLLPLEVDLEILPFDRMQLVLQPDDTGFAIRGFLLPRKNGLWSTPSISRSLGGLQPAKLSKVVNMSVT